MPSIKEWYDIVKTSVMLIYIHNLCTLKGSGQILFCFFIHFQVTMNYCVKSVYFIVNITVLWVSAIVSKPCAFMVHGMEFVSQLHITY